MVKNIFSKDKESEYFIKVQYSDISIYAICMVNKKLDMIYIKITGYFLLD